MLSGFRRAQPELVELTEEQQALASALADEYDSLVDSGAAEDGDEAVLARLEEIQDALDALSRGRFRGPTETLAIAGAVVTPAYDGWPDVLAGLVRRGNEPERAEDVEMPRKPTGISATLVESLTAEKSSIVSRALASSPGLALAAVVHALALTVIYRFGCEHSCLQIVVRDAGPGCGDDTDPSWGGRLPDEPEALWAWCLSQSQDTLLALLAHVAALARALGIDMAKVFTPSVENYFSRISGAQIVMALCEAKGVPAAPSWSKMKRAELAALAARLSLSLNGTREQFSDLFRLLEAQRAKEFYFTVEEAEQDNEWPVRSWGMAARLN
ncbi:hypothetical protein [Rhizobium grahamii]|uniref:Uncharacterized protein n=1 Tax=Rhizobium grahamii TaxID=1120045 RepID=A0A370KF47_9HYPH|nr:hypothetical protein [Rhizobium grahamii]RDJ02957.1 hypothetical protein B5K06_31170 [Rhizobium grahamii]